MKEKNNVLENWSIGADPLSPYDAPETAVVRLYGEIYNDDRFTNGTYIHTSRLKTFDSTTLTATTKSGTIYSLGSMNEDFKNFLDRGGYKLCDYDKQ